MVLSLPFSLKSKRSASSRFNSSSAAFATLPLSIYGKVNVDNIPDKHYEIIKGIADETLKRSIKWKPQSFISLLTQRFLKNDSALVYTGYYNGLNITLSNTTKGQTAIRITTGLTRKVFLDTFTPFKPEIRNGKRVGTLRAMLLYNLYKAIRYQVDGELLPS